MADRWLTDTLERQLARADLLILSKADLADRAARAATRAAVQRIRPDAAVAEISDGAIPEALLGFGAATGSAPRFVADLTEHGFRSWYWPATGLLDEGKLRAVLAGLPDSVLRAKGICRVWPGSLPHVLHLVGRRVVLAPWQGPDPPCGIVLIGTHDMPSPEALASMIAAAIRAEDATPAA